jgi:hypothetical protein
MHPFFELLRGTVHHGVAVPIDAILLCIDLCMGIAQRRTSAGIG